ncbi:MAG: ethylbenzene dehydrogenase-related protein [Burkholderiaceae bacterium]|jgi:hypothetical protein|nr:ethylbenzene dehydrogenase-related protein [Burkholderiaceae bacterium]
MNPTKTAIQMGATALITLASGAALAAPPDWSKVPQAQFTLFYPGVSPLEWVTKGTEHGGARGLKKDETCKSCHSEETADMGKKIASGEKLEPNPVKGRAGSIPVSVQAANDGAQLYLRFSWKQPPAASGAEKLDKDNQVKITVALEDNKVAGTASMGCWVMCHGDVRTMPGVNDDKKTKYVKDGSLASGKFIDLMQWASKTGQSDGYVADKRVMTGGKALVEAKGEQKGDEWVVVFTRKLAGAGSDGDITLASGKTYEIGFAIHDDHSGGRFHDVSLNYTLGIDTKADITANKQ